MYIEQTNRELHKLTIDTRTVQILQGFRIRVSRIPTISITFHHIGNPQICGEYLAEKGEGGFLSSSSDDEHSTYRKRRMPVLAIAYASPRIPLPMMALLRLKTDIPKEVFPSN